MFLSASVESRGTASVVRARTLVAAAGGFEANHRVAEGILGDGRRQFPDPRHALQSRHDAEDADRARRPAGRRPHAVPRRGDRRARAEIRRRHHHPARLRASSASCVNTQRPSASTTRARISGRSATRSGAGSSPRSPTRSPTSSSTRRRSSCSCRRSIPPIDGRQHPRAGRQARARSGRAGADGRATSMPPCGPALSTTTILDDCRTEGLDAAEIALGAAHRDAALLRLPGAARHHLHLSRHAREQARRAC